MLILCLCPERYHWKLIPGYAAAFRRRGIEFFCIEDTFPFNAPLEEILKLCPSPPSWIFQFDSDYPLLPQGLTMSEIPTVCFRTDIYVYTDRQMRWSSLFDHVAVFHPGYERLFHEAGHPGAFTLPWAVRGELFEGPELPREYDVGWVGQASGAIYKKRAMWLPILASIFRLNDWSRTYTQAEVADIYRRSRVVVNISRDDFPRDANIRVFEALASGALLITSIPTELSELGFEEGVHFVGYNKEHDIIPLVRFYLDQESERLRIAQAARTKALEEHTYDSRVTQLIEHLQKSCLTKSAPARLWPEHRIRLMYLDFFASVGLVDYCAKEYRHILGRGVRETIEGATLMGKAWTRKRGASHRRES